MLKFKTEQGEYTTPRKGDYALASDIKNEAMHNQVREAFGAAGCEISIDVDGSRCEFCPFVAIESVQNSCGEVDVCLVWDAEIDRIQIHELRVIKKNHVGRRIIPTKQTLFEAACDAEDGARFKCHGYAGEFVRTNVSDLIWINDGVEIHGAPFRAMKSTDFEQLPSGPKKCPLQMCDWVHKIRVPSSLKDDARYAVNLMSELMRWEGAQIGAPVLSMGVSSAVYIPVVFNSQEQREAAVGDVCPDAVSLDMVSEK